ncbi:SCO3374 family protein [Streptomyces mangrovisoli]|uniref:Proline-rich protein n=1 Tax=Streptomyces mangrovisoli TaxID=1428628 RepID=A0A1J4NXK1_9ACTN|nr:SCO3374 family protein [Streptomyces mangrovisoli]OIJ65862.1 hypothetical protein WN71_021685 [Streptomyces mangrovisoli]
MVGMTPLAVPQPRRAIDPSAVRDWYEKRLGWATAPGPAPGSLPRLVTGARFDVLEVPARAGGPALRHLGPGSPVALQGGRMRFLVAAGSAEELPGVLDWLEWGPLAAGLDLVALGAGGHIDAPSPWRTASVQGAAVWLRPPGPGREVEPSLPTLSALGGGEGAPDLVRLVDTVATQCHRILLRRPHGGPPAVTQAQPLAFS